MTPDFEPITQHLIPRDAASARSQVLEEFNVDAWMFTNDAWVMMRDDGQYVPHEQNTIDHEPPIVDDFTPYLDAGLQDRRRQRRCGRCCSAARRRCRRRSATAALAVRSQTYYLDVTPPGQDKGSFVDAMAQAPGRSGIGRGRDLGDMQNDLPMFARSGMSFAMGNATDDVKAQATHVTASNKEDGFAKGIDWILKEACG